MKKNKPSHTPDVATEMENEISFWLAKSLKSVTSGSVELYASDKPALKIEVINNKDINKKININFLEPELFNIDIVKDEVEENIGFFDKLKNAFDLTKMILDKDVKVLSFSELVKCLVSTFFLSYSARINMNDIEKQKQLCRLFS